MPPTTTAAPCEQYIKEGKGAIKWTRLSCRSFAANAVRLQLHALAYNLGNFMRTLAMPKTAEPWSLTSLRQKLIKIGAKVVSHGRYVTFLRIRARRGHQIAAVAVARKLAVLCWHLLTKSADYQWARPALVASKLRAMELQAGQPARKGNKRGPAYAYNVKALRDREIELARHAEQAYERFVSQWQRRGTAKQRTGAANEERR